MVIRQSLGLCVHVRVCGLALHRLQQRKTRPKRTPKRACCPASVQTSARSLDNGQFRSTRCCVWVFNSCQGPRLLYPAIREFTRSLAHKRTRAIYRLRLGSPIKRVRSVLAFSCIRQSIQYSFKTLSILALFVVLYSCAVLAVLLCVAGL
jgi:hypothetical protein